MKPICPVNFFEVEDIKSHSTEASAPLRVINNNTKFLDRQILAKSVYPDQTAPSDQIYVKTVCYCICITYFSDVKLFFIFYISIIYCIYFLSWQPFSIVDSPFAQYQLGQQVQVDKTVSSLLSTRNFIFPITVMILSFWTDMPGQTVQTQIRLLLQKQSDQGLHCLPFRLHRLDSLLYGRTTQLKF